MLEQMGLSKYSLEIYGQIPYEYSTCSRHDERLELQ